MMADIAWWLIPTLALVAIMAVVVIWRPVRGILQEIQTERAREMFSLQRERLEAKFLDLAAASGKPRGLRWKDCDFDNPVRFARDKRSGQLAALVSISVSFDAIEGSDMEDLPAVGNLREATAVFFFHKGHWHTGGQALFNMNPDEALDHFKSQYERVEMS